MKKQPLKTVRQQSAWSPVQKISFDFVAEENISADRKNDRWQRRDQLTTERARNFFPAGEWVNRGENDGLDFFL